MEKSIHLKKVLWNGKEMRKDTVFHIPFHGVLWSVAVILLHLWLSVCFTRKRSLTTG